MALIFEALSPLRSTKLEHDMRTSLAPDRFIILKKLTKKRKTSKQNHETTLENTKSQSATTGVVVGGGGVRESQAAKCLPSFDRNFNVKSCPSICAPSLVGGC